MYVYTSYLQIETSTDMDLEYMEGDNFTVDNLDGEYYKVITKLCTQTISRCYNVLEVYINKQLRLTWGSIARGELSNFIRWNYFFVASRVASARFTSDRCCCLTSPRRSCSSAPPLHYWPLSHITRSRKNHNDRIAERTLQGCGSSATRCSGARSVR